MKESNELLMLDPLLLRPRNVSVTVNRRDDQELAQEIIQCGFNNLTASGTNREFIRLNVGESKLKNIMAVFECLTKEQKEALWFDSSITPFKLKSPLFFVTTGAGLLVSFTIAFIKGMTCSFAADGFNGINIYIFAILTILSSLYQLKFINLSMEIYEQVDTIPIFQSS